MNRRRHPAIQTDKEPLSHRVPATPAHAARTAQRSNKNPSMTFNVTVLSKRFIDAGRLPCGIASGDADLTG
jgi:hypothetical protein